MNSTISDRTTGIFMFALSISLFIQLPDLNEIDKFLDKLFLKEFLKDVLKEERREESSKSKEESNESNNFKELIGIHRGKKCCDNIKCGCVKLLIKNKPVTTSSYFMNSFVLKQDENHYCSAGVFLYYHENDEIEFLAIEELRNGEKKNNLPGGKREFKNHDKLILESSKETAYFEFMEELNDSTSLIFTFHNSTITELYWSHTSKAIIYIVKSDKPLPRSNLQINAKIINYNKIDGVNHNKIDGVKENVKNDVKDGVKDNVKIENVKFHEFVILDIKTIISSINKKLKTNRTN